MDSSPEMISRQINEQSASEPLIKVFAQDRDGMTARQKDTFT